MLDGFRSESQALYDSWKNGTAEQQKWAANLDAKWNGKLSGTKSNRISLKKYIAKPANYYDTINYNNPNDNYFS